MQSYRLGLGAVPALAMLLAATVWLAECRAAVPLVGLCGQGELIQTCGDLGVTAGGEGTTSQLLSRVLLYLVYGKVQARFGATLDPAGPALPVPPQVHTPRQLALAVAQDAAVVLQGSFGGEPAPAASDGYRIGPGRGGEAPFWAIRSPPGRQAFAPWLRLPLGSAEVAEGLTYRLTVQARLSGIDPKTFAPAHFELRFLDRGGAELPHPHVATPKVPADPSWQEVVCQDVAPAGAVRATVSLSAMLPAGRLWLKQLKLAQVLSPAATFATEQPLAARITEHPRVFLSPSQAGDLAQWVSDTRETPFATSRAGLFRSIRDRADAYLAEAEIGFEKRSLPWPPVEMPKEGGGLSWNPLATAIADRLASLSLVYAATGDEKYGRRAADLLAAISRWPQWHDSVTGTPGLDVGYIAFAAAVVLVTLCEFGETRADAVSLKVGGGRVDLSCQVSGKACRIRLALAGDRGESPRLTVTEDRRTRFDGKRLAVPADTPG